MVIVDTSVWIDYFRGSPTPEADWLDAALERMPLALTDRMLCEVLQGISRREVFEQVSAALQRFTILSTGGVELAEAAARAYRTLKTNGITIRRTANCWTAAVCLSGDHLLLHADAEYNPFEWLLGLKTVKCRPQPGSRGRHG